MPTENLHHNGVINVLSNSNYEYRFFIKDHLGNTRVVCQPDFNSNGTLKDKPNELQRSDYYPFGILHGGREAQPTAENENRYLYNDKEYQARKWDNYGYTFYSSLHWYDYGARFYDVQLGRWHSVDPLAEKYLAWSPYHYTYCNPIRFIDPDGMQIDPASQKEWDNQKRKVERKKDRFQRKVDRLNTKASQKGWSSNKLAKRIGNKSDRLNSLKSTLTTMGKLESKSNTQVYSLTKITDGSNGDVSLNPTTKAINISFGNTANFVHEVTHAGQFESGDIAFDGTTGATLAQDVDDEVSAYKSQFAYSPSSVSGLASTSVANSFASITPTWVQGLAGGTLYSPGGSANTGIIPLNINSTKAQLIRAYPHNAALNSLPAGFILKSSYPNIYYK